MKKLNINLENCYGIKKLEYEFKFNDKNTYIIYAPNGTMKTSFAKTFKDYSKNETPKDLIFRDKETLFEILDETLEPISPESIFVIEPYNATYESDKISTLLVNKELKKEYDEIYIDIDRKKELIIKELKQLSGLKKNIDEIFSYDVVSDNNSFYIALLRLEDEILNNADDSLKTVNYSILFNEKVQQFLETKDFKEKLENYINIYDRLISNSTFFSRGNFDHYNATNVEKSLKTNRFFLANHSVYINQEGEKKEIKSDEELAEAINIEKSKILENDDLKKAFSIIDNAIQKNKELVEFRHYLLERQDLLPKFNNLKKLKQDIWIAYLSSIKETYKNTTEKYRENRDRLKEIAEAAENESTKWQAIINIFNERFFVPFNVKIKNKTDAIVGKSVPTIKFDFKDYYEDTNIISIEKDTLLNVLSQGEKRALYILNIIFEIEARKELKQPSVLIIDDIADSFDYKNKYAIIEYLKEITTSNNFYQLILTHNFDFYRTTYGRLGIPRANRLQSIKTKDGINLIETKYQKDVFKTWIKNLSSGNIEQVIALIPFIRNIAEYTLGENSKEYTILTSLLHVKKETKNITVEQFINIIKNIVDETIIPEIRIDLSSTILEELYQAADEIENSEGETLELEQKIVLSIAIRLKTEEFMIQEINNEESIAQIQKNQTQKLIEMFQELFSDKKEVLKILRRVNLMTPENIHLNSLMYEPILDMSNEHLKQLYSDVKNLFNRL